MLYPLKEETETNSEEWYPVHVYQPIQFIEEVWSKGQDGLNINNTLILLYYTFLWLWGFYDLTEWKNEMDDKDPLQ